MPPARLSVIGGSDEDGTCDGSNRAHDAQYLGRHERPACAAGRLIGIGDPPVENLIE